MKYPTLPEQNITRELIDTFRGYNHNLRIAEGEFYNMGNMSSDYFPLIAPRQQRGTFVSSGNINGMIAKDELCYVDGTEFVKGTQRIEMGLTDTPKELISMGAYVIILPDKKYINTTDLTDYGNIEASFETLGQYTFSCALCRESGEQYQIRDVGDTEPTTIAEGVFWLDTSTTPAVLKQYSETTASWNVVSPTYVKLNLGMDTTEMGGIEEMFNVGDTVEISGLPANNGLDRLNGNRLIVNRTDLSIIVEGIIDSNGTGGVSAVTVKRTMPIMDFVFESGNRLWGCRYGENTAGEFVNEIYASKLGDFRNWSSYLGISTDSYTASLGTNGSFTGAVSYMGYPIFFKENCMHKVYGNNPPYTIQDTACRGVQSGSSKSLAIVNEVLYYKSIYGVCAYDGSLPIEISNALGGTEYSNAVGGAYGNKYYISMKDKSNVYHLFVYDTAKGMWHREDNANITQFCPLGNEMYYTDSLYNSIKTIFGGGTVETAPINWHIETGIIGFDSPDKKYILNLIIRLSLELGARVFFYIQYDSCGTWEHIYTVSSTNLRSINVPIRPHRCDHFRLKITGEGYSKIYSICKTLEEGSNL